MGSGLLSSFGLNPMAGAGAPTEDIWQGDTGHINKLDKREASQGKTTTSVITGDRQDKGEETYIEVKGPTNVGTRTSVPYQKVLPSYKRKAEQAIQRHNIPKQHEKRVKQYFDSLGH